MFISRVVLYVIMSLLFYLTEYLKLLSTNIYAVIQIQENKEELKSKLKESLRGKSDAFNQENPEEDNVSIS